MVILSQNRSDKSFFIGASFQEYFEQIKPLKRLVKKDIISEERLITDPRKEWIYGDYKNMLLEVYGWPEIFDVYVVVDKDLLDAVIVSENLPIAPTWNAYSPWEIFAPREIKNIEEIRNIDFV